MKRQQALVGGIWCIVTISYFYEEGQNDSPFTIKELKPVQMPNTDLDALLEARREFSEEITSPEDLALVDEL